jgi:hypothetical protein
MTIILKLDQDRDLCISFERNDSLILEAIHDNTYVSISTTKSYKYYNNIFSILIIIFIIFHLLYIYYDDIYVFILVNKNYFMNTISI